MCLRNCMKLLLQISQLENKIREVKENTKEKNVRPKAQ